VSIEIKGALGAGAGSRVHRALALAVVFLVVVAWPASAAVRARVVDLRAISGGSPFKPGGCGVFGQPTFDSEAEPSLAVNPRDPRNLVAVWQQDRFPVDGGALSNVVAVSKNGGRSWRQVLVPRISRCTGGADERSSDPWLSIGPDGKVYLASLTFTENPLLVGLAGPTNQLVSRSTDGGLKWSAPTTVVANGAYNDREQITADPWRPGTAFEVWVNRLGIFGQTGVNEFVRTSDGGRTFSAAKATYAAASDNLPDPTLISVLSDGTLINVFMLANASAVLGPKIPFKVMAMRSVDGGRRWSTPITLGEVPPLAPYDSTTNVQVRAFPIVSTATAPDGTVYAVWNDIESEHRASIRISRSVDDGRTWTRPRTVRRIAAQAFLPSVAVDRRGTVGVLWDDLRHDVPGDGQLTTDVWFASSGDGGRSFRETHVSGPFNAAAAPSTSSTGVEGRFLGDYQGFAALPSGFAAAFAESGKTHGPSDIFFARIEVPAQPGTTVRLLVRPNRTSVGARTSFRFEAFSSDTGRRLVGALIRFAGHRALTGPGGRATITVRLCRPGASRATASFAGLRAGSATVLAVP
jgi:hypothetical protein